MIDINGLDFYFGDNKVIHNVNVNFSSGKLYSIIGTNGSGKTTLINCMSGHYKTNGKIFVNGKDINEYKNKQLAKLISVVPQHTNSAFDFSVLDMVLMGRNPYIGRFESESTDDFNIAKEAMETTGIWKLKHRRISELSGGERQRVIISRALAQQTPIILLDEPVSSLDMFHQLKIMELLYKLKQNKILITVMHDVNLAARYSDYFILMREGKIVGTGAPRDVLDEKNIKTVYDVDSVIIKSPIYDSPFVIPSLSS